MNPPTTVNWKIPKLIGLAAVSLSLLSLELPSAVAQTSPTRTVDSGTPDGTYLYGEVPRPNQLNKGYVVFQKQRGSIVGAIYAPSSDFECFSGSLSRNTLNIKSVAIEEAPMNVKIDLSNLHQIKPISANEQRLISMCKSEVLPD